MQLEDTSPKSIRVVAAARIRTIAGPVVVGTTVSFVFVFLMASGFHAPRPHALPVALAAPRAAAARISSEIAADAPGAFALQDYTSQAAVEHAVTDGDVVGGLAIGTGGATIVTAGAQGMGTVQALTSALGSIAQANAMPVREIDVKPLPAQDSFGLAGLVVVIGITLASMIFAASMFASGAATRLPGRQLLAVIVGFSVLAGAAAALSVGTIVGAVSHFWGVAGVAALVALAVAGTTLALGRALGAPGLGLGALLVVMTSISTSGTAVGYRFEPAFHRALSQWLPAGSAVEALRDVLYFGGAHLTGRLAVLAGWAAAAVLVIAATAARAQRRAETAPAQTPRDASEHQLAAQAA